MPDPRQLLLDRIIGHLSRTGSHDASLRAIATGVGSSHRMLLYHFGSHEGLILAVVDEIEERQRAFLAELASDPGLSLAEITLRLWRRLSAQELAPFVRLFFDLYSRMLQTDDGRAAALVNSWLAPGELMMVQRGLSRAEARRTARITLAVVRGLLLDVLATGERRAADAAMKAFAARLPM